VATEGSSSQRAYRAACPSCGAPVEFRSAASASAVCSFCRSTLVRDGDALQRIGVSSELFDDHSPLQLGAAGKFQGLAFTLVGRLQYAYADGTWNEWHALFDNGRSGWLSEDNGAYVFSFEATLETRSPRADELRAGQQLALAGSNWDIAAVTTTRLLAAQGELPFAPALQGEFVVVDLRNAQGEVGTLDYGAPGLVHWAVGRSVLLADLALVGLRENNEKTLAAQSVECPSCGSSLELRLASTQSISCHQCNAVIDVSQKVGGALAHYSQNNSGHDGAQPALPLGSTAVLALGKEGPLPWTVVGMVERCDVAQAGDDEVTYWREYLTFNHQAGFAFLVDAEDGWSWVRPITGAPQVRGSQAHYDGVTYTQRYAYGAKVTWVQGEFYWRVRRDERARVTDYAAGGKRLSREESGNEVTWSAGEAIDAHVLADAFDAPISSPPDVSPLSDGLRKPSATGTTTIVWIVVALIVLLVIMDACSDSTGFRGSGGSYGGWSSGGGHK
jgi:ribosomal protein L37AE/L43A